MKRIPRGRRSNRPQHGPMGSGSSGPSGGGAVVSSLSTDHQQLHDLDLELALLKRKREIIEQQHKILAHQQRFDNRSNNYDFNQQQSIRPLETPQANPTMEFSQYYNNPTGIQFDSRGTKRLLDDNWQSNLPSKRFGGTTRDNPINPSGSRFGQVYSSGPRGSFTNQKPASRSLSRSEPLIKAKPATHTLPRPEPLMKITWPRPLSTKRRDFNPAKVTKPKHTSAPNKLDSYPTSERKNLINEASDLVANPKEDDFILHADKPASRQVSGRLELALGSIFKEVKIACGNVEYSGAALRVMKQEIRDRIRSVMIGKHVSNANDIINKYRVKFPMKTDKEICEIAKNFEQRQSKPKLRPEDPEKYFKTHFYKLLNNKLDEMFSKLQKLYENQYDKDKSLSEIINSIWQETENKIESTDVENQVKSTNESHNETNMDEQVNTKISDVTVEHDKNEPQNSKDDKDKSELENTQNAYKSNNENILDDSENVSNNIANASETKDETKLDDSANVSNNSAIASEDNETKLNDSANAPNDSANASENKDEIKLDDSTNASEDKDKSKLDDSANLKLSKHLKQQSEYEEGRRANFYNRVIGLMLNNKLPHVLPKFKESIISILNIDQEFRATKAALIVETNKMAEKLQNEHNVVADDTENTPKPKQALRTMPYYVKVLGRPALPKRKLMQSFLDQFHPSSIKKHRGIHNLLFVAFNVKEDFENILAANQSVVGQSTLEISISEKKDTKKKTANVDDDVIIIESNDAPIVLNDSQIELDMELDNQISNLLSSIREEEEKEHDKRSAQPNNNQHNITEKQNENKTNDDTEKEINNEINEMGEGTAEDKDFVEQAQDNTEETEDIAEQAEDNIEEIQDTTEETQATEQPRDISVQIKSEDKTEISKNDDKVKNDMSVKTETKETPAATATRSSSRLATSTPSTIRTRRASRMAQNN